MWTHDRDSQYKSLSHLKETSTSHLCLRYRTWIEFKLKNKRKLVIYIVPRILQVRAGNH